MNKTAEEFLKANDYPFGHVDPTVTDSLIEWMEEYAQSLHQEGPYYVECDASEAIGYFHGLTIEGLKTHQTPLKKSSLTVQPISRETDQIKDIAFLENMNNLIDGLLENEHDHAKTEELSTMIKDWLGELKDKSVISQHPMSEGRIEELAEEYSKGHYTDSESIKQAYDDFYLGMKSAIKELSKEGECPNCHETSEECACIRNKCNKCGKPVGNITFTVCDDCWDSKEGEQSAEEIHYDALQECCHKILDAIDEKEMPQRAIKGLRILLNR